MALIFAAPSVTMSLPMFFVAALQEKKMMLDEETSKHMIGVLRMKRGEEVLLTDGKGRKANAVITDDNRKKCTVEITSTSYEEQAASRIAIGISLLKNSSRFEWFLEKATEIGVQEIIPLLCERTEKEKFRMDRMQQIVVSALLQSQQSWMPHLHVPIAFEKILKLPYQNKFIAHCLPESKQRLPQLASDTTLLLIGPEGDFTANEIGLAVQNQFHPVTLGSTRLRTETAGMVAAAILRLGGS